jgi:DNA-directed RNA polymerase subunit RPC12/RpoP
METQAFAGNYGKPVVLDVCFSCGAIWFDGLENLQLTPGSILTLFKLIHEKHALHSNAADRTLQCPRCQRKLVHTGDRQRTTRFFYELCPREHGRLITFFQFLREKNFIRDLSAKEMEELRRRVQVLHCSNCGAGIDLTKDSRCSYCRSPVSMLDPQQMEKTMRELHQLEERRTTPGLRTPSVGRELQIERLSRSWRSVGGALSPGEPLVIQGAFDLVSSGIEAAVHFFSDPG